MPDTDIASPHASHDAYAVAERIAVGHAGVVYRAVQSSTGREVLFKVLSHATTHPLDPAQILVLKESVDRVQHPCIAEWIDAYDDPEGFVLVHDFRKGVAGNVFPSQRKLTPAEARLLAMQLCGALQAGERAGLPHGDIKPSNIVISDDPAQGLSLRVYDWGLSACRAQQPLESLLCMAPERLRGAAPSVQGDLFATGATLAFLLTDCFPAHGGTVEEILEVWQRFDPHAIAQARPDLDEHFCKWLAWLMRLQATDRPASLAQAREVLDQVISYASHAEKKLTAPPAATPPPAPAPTPQPSAPMRRAPAAATTFLPVNPIAAVTRSNAAAPPAMVPGARRTFGAKVVLGLFIICAFAVAFAGLGWWAESHYGAGWLRERWDSLRNPAPKSAVVVETRTSPPTPPAPVTTPPPATAAKNSAAKKTAKTASPAPAAPGVARETFTYPAGPKLDGAAGGSGWAGPWSATNVAIGESADKKSVVAQIGGAQDGGARRVIGPFAKVASREVYVVFTVWHPGADGPALVVDALGDGKTATSAPVLIDPQGGAIGVKAGGGDTVTVPAEQSFRVVLRWDFKRQKNGKYDVETGAWLNPDAKSKDPVASSPVTRFALKGQKQPTALTLTFTAKGAAKRAATIGDIRVAPTIQEALR